MCASGHVGVRPSKSERQMYGLMPCTRPLGIRPAPPMPSMATTQPLAHAYIQASATIRSFLLSAKGALGRRMQGGEHRGILEPATRECPAADASAAV